MKKGTGTFFSISLCLLLLLISLPAYSSDSILIIRIEGDSFEQALQGLKEELDEEFSLEEIIVDKKSSPEEISEDIENISPRLVVLMDNVATSLYNKHQKGLPESEQKIPSISLMASFMDYAISDLKNATGIFYEVPLVTSVVNLRSIMPSVTFKKVGVLHRSFMEDSIQKNRAYCAREGILLVSHAIPNSNFKPRDIKKGLKKLKDEKIDALWIPNDSRLVNSSLLKSVWLPFKAKFKKPVIVGVEILVNPKLRFGTFAVIPDHVSMGTQAAEMVFDIMENNWKVTSGEIEPPRSVYKIINLKQARKLFSVEREKVQNVVDKIME